MSDGCATRTGPWSAKPANAVLTFGPRERAAIEIAGWMGPRRSEGFGLKWRDLDFVRRVIAFRQGFVAGRITPLKTEASQAGVSMPEDVVNALLAWREITPYRAPDDWVFASPVTKGKRPYWRDSMLRRTIRPIAERNNLGHIGWHTFRHSFVSWGKAVLKLEETKELVRHQDIQTTSNKYGELPLQAKRDASERLIEYVKQSARTEVNGRMIEKGLGGRKLRLLSVPSCP